tara:strand:- start:300 stop:719 length:420 start_codon:yes stop_codon:yes gene_type:complete
VTRGTTFFGDKKFPEFWPASIEHDLHYEAEVYGAALDHVFVQDCDKIYNNLTGLTGLAASRFHTGYRLYEWNSEKDQQLSRREADLKYSRYLQRVIGAETNYKRARQLRMSRRQRMFFLRMPEPVKKIALFFNRIFGGA